MLYDEVCYLAHSIKILERMAKRNILAEIAKIFDPMGLLGPMSCLLKN